MGFSTNPKIFVPPREAPGWHPPVLPKETSQQTNKSHGRVETRRLTVVPDEENYLQGPGLRQTFQLERQVFHPKKGVTTTEVSYGITSLAPYPGCADQLLNWIRQHWGT